MAAIGARGVVGLVTCALLITSCGTGSTIGAGSGGLGDGLGETEPTVVTGGGARASVGDTATSTLSPAPPTLSDQAMATSTAPVLDTLPPSEAPTTAGGGSDGVAAPTTTSALVDESSITVASTLPPSTGDPPGGPAGPVASSTIVVTSPETTSATAPSNELAAGETAAFDLLNDRRAELGRAPTSRDSRLDIQARRWSRHMALSGDFGHSASPHAENIAFTSNTDLTAAEAAGVFHALWVDSAEHDANITSEDHLVAGVGLFKSDEGWYGTQLYAGERP